MQTYVVEVWGDFACFTRPEAKVERFSYPLMTPSAARGVLDAIYAKPEEFGWRIDQIEVLKPIKFIALRRNEVKEKINANAVKRAMESGDGPIILCDATKELTGSDMVGRTQRQTMALRDVRYRIHAHIHSRPGFEARRRGLEEQAARRISHGKCFYQPYLGCREFVAYFQPAVGEAQPADESVDIGWMLYDVFDLDRVVRDEAQPFISLFQAKLEKGVLKVPAWESPEVHRPAGRR
jgi:CRISPR-associated protein Cas5d